MQAPVSVAAHYALALAAVILTAVAQVFLKVGAARLNRGFMRSFLDVRVACAYAILLFVTVLNVVAYRVPAGFETSRIVIGAIHLPVPAGLSRVTSVGPANTEHCAILQELPQLSRSRQRLGRWARRGAGPGRHNRIQRPGGHCRDHERLGVVTNSKGHASSYLVGNNGV